jgi:DNA-binding response OmpR family regulator
MALHREVEGSLLQNRSGVARSHARVLVVDDSPTDLALIAGPLREQGFEVVTASNGDEALEKALHQQPACILLDIVLPGRDGFQVCRELKRRPESAHIPVIIISGKNGRVDRMWGLRQGAALYLTKPFGVDELLAGVRHCLEQ